MDSVPAEGVSRQPTIDSRVVLPDPERAEHYTRLSAAEGEAHFLQASSASGRYHRPWRAEHIPRAHPLLPSKDQDRIDLERDRMETKEASRQHNKVRPTRTGETTSVVWRGIGVGADRCAA